MPSPVAFTTASFAVQIRKKRRKHLGLAICRRDRIGFPRRKEPPRDCRIDVAHLLDIDPHAAIARYRQHGQIAAVTEVEREPAAPRFVPHFQLRLAEFTNFETYVMRRAFRLSSEDDANAAPRHGKPVALPRIKKPSGPLQFTFIENIAERITERRQFTLRRSDGPVPQIDTHHAVFRSHFPSPAPF